MELTPLRYFHAIAQSGGMTTAARRLGVTQPALSAAIRKLEEEVGAPLFNRQGRGLSLTEAGARFLPHAREALSRAEDGVRAVRQLLGMEVGQIRVGGGATAITYLMPPVVSALRRAYPGLRFYVREAGSEATVGAVLRGELDLGIVTLPDRPEKGADQLHVIPLVTDELRLILTPGHRLAAGGRARGSFRWRDLASEPVVAFEDGSAVREMIDTRAAAAGVTLDVVMELRSIQGITRMVSAGVGVGFVSRFALRDRSPWGEGLTCRDGRLTRRLAVVRRRDRLPGPAALEFERRLLKAHRGKE